MRKKKIDNLPMEIQELNLSDEIKRCIYDKGITSIEDLKRLRYGDFPDWSKRRVNIILNEVAPGTDPVISLCSERLEKLKELYSKKIKDDNFYSNQVVDDIKTEVLNSSVLDLDISLRTVLELKKKNMLKIKELLQYVYGDDGTINYIQDRRDLKRLINIADYFNLPIKNDPRIRLRYDMESIENYGIELLYLYGAENILKRRGIKTIGKLLRTTKDELYEILDRRRADLVINRIHSYGASFIDEEGSYVDEDIMNEFQESYEVSKVYEV